MRETQHDPLSQRSNARGDQVSPIASCLTRSADAGSHGLSFQPTHRIAIGARRDGLAPRNALLRQDMLSRKNSPPAEGVPRLASTATVLFVQKDGNYRRNIYDARTRKVYATRTRQLRSTSTRSWLSIKHSSRHQLHRHRGSCDLRPIDNPSIVDILSLIFY